MPADRKATYFLAPGAVPGTAWVVHSDRCHAAAMDGPAELLGRFRDSGPAIDEAHGRRGKIVACPCCCAG